MQAKTQHADGGATIRPGKLPCGQAHQMYYNNNFPPFFFFLFLGILYNL